MNAIPAKGSGVRPDAYTPPPWEAFFEFVHLVYVGFIVTFGPWRAGERRSEVLRSQLDKISHDLANPCQTPTRASTIDWQAVPRNTS
jgi:hypothetical protein